MHSYIIEMGEAPIRTPVDIYDIMGTSFSWVATYVDEISPEVKETVKSDFLTGFIDAWRDYVDVTDDTITFKQGFRDAYSEKVLECVKDAVKTATKDDIKDAHLRTILKEYLGGSGIYIYIDDGFFEENTFLTESVQEGVPYYIGGILSYKG